MSEPVCILQQIFPTKSKFLVHLLPPTIAATLKIGKILSLSHVARSEKLYIHPSFNFSNICSAFLYFLSNSYF